MFDNIAIEIVYCLVGLVLGGIIGVFAMALCNIAAASDRHLDYFHTGNDEGKVYRDGACES